MSVIREDDPKWQSFIGRMHELSRSSVNVGVLGSGKANDSHGDGVSVVDVATWNEFGVIVNGKVHIPERPFLRGTIDKKHRQITQFAQTEILGVAAGKKSPDDAYERVGLFTVSAVQERIADGIPPVNADSTIERKGSDKPLIDTGQLRSSITHEVKR